MSAPPFDRFETEIHPVGRSIVLLARREGLGSETRLYRGPEEGTSFAALDAPERIHAFAAREDCWVALTEDSLFESRDNGASWIAAPLGSATTWAAVVLVGSEAWLVAGNRVLRHAAGTTELRWQVPGAGAERLSALIPLGAGGALLTSDAGRILRGREGVTLLADWSQGLPAQSVGCGAPTLGRVGDLWLAYLGDLHARREDDPAWTRLPPEEEPDGSFRDALRWLAPTESAQWVELPWEPGSWLGTDSANLFFGGPGRGLSTVWRRPDGRTSIKQLAAGPRLAYASLRNATPARVGVVLSRAGADLMRLG